MAFCQRPTARFFAAFYRWSRYTQRNGECGHVLSRHPVALQHRRSSISHQLPRPPLERRDATAQTTQTEASSASEGVIDNQDAQGEGLVVNELETSDGIDGDSDLGGRLRAVMRHMPSSITIITAASKDPVTEAPVPLGMAISSFNTVSLDPPHVSFNIRFPSKTLDAIRDAKGLFRVHFLAAKQQAARFVELFTQGNTPAALLHRARAIPLHMPKDANHISTTTSLAPQILHRHVVAALECELTQEVLVADHVIVVARVKYLQSSRTPKPMLLYHDGAYHSIDHNTKISEHGINKVAENPPAEGYDMYYQYPFVPGEAERQDLRDRLKMYIKDKCIHLQDRERAIKELKTVTPDFPFGISLAHLMEEVRTEAGLKSGIRKDFRNHPAVYDFWGTLSKRDIAAIVERAKKLVRANPASLALHYHSFLSYIGVCFRSKNLLASDILDPLRAEGIVSPFGTQPLPSGEDPSFRPTLEVMENAEFQIRQYMEKTPSQKIEKLEDDEIAWELGFGGWALPHITDTRLRIHVETHPDEFSAQYFDISGELTTEEIRVALGRIIKFLDIHNNNTTLRRELNTSLFDILKTIRVHPESTGINVAYLLGRLKHMYNTTPRYREFVVAVEKMLRPWYVKKTFEWDDFQSRARSLVQKHALRVVRWQPEDWLIAMGIDPRSKIKTPLSAHKPSLLQSGLLPMVIAKELKNFYGKGTSEENEAITTYLKKMYDYDVRLPASNPVVVQEDAQIGSDEEMREAMLSNLNVNVLPKTRARQELEEALKEFGDGWKARGQRSVEDREVASKIRKVPI